MLPLGVMNPPPGLLAPLQAPPRPKAVYLIVFLLLIAIGLLAYAVFAGPPATPLPVGSRALARCLRGVRSLAPGASAQAR
jgi:hypothetical protein